MLSGYRGTLRLQECSPGTGVPFLHDIESFHLEIKKKLSTAFHPKTNGQNKRPNNTMEVYLRAFINLEQKNWLKLLSKAEFIYNNSKITSTGDIA